MKKENKILGFTAYVILEISFQCEKYILELVEIFNCVLISMEVVGSSVACGFWEPDGPKIQMRFASGAILPSSRFGLVRMSVAPEPINVLDGELSVSSSLRIVRPDRPRKEKPLGSHSSNKGWGWAVRDYVTCRSQAEP